MHAPRLIAKRRPQMVFIARRSPRDRAFSSLIKRRVSRVLHQVLLAIIAGLGVERSSLAQCGLGRLHPQPVQPAAAFGWSIAAQADRAVVGAYYGGESDLGTGVCYVFHRQGVSWTQESRLLASDAAFGDYFGTSVAIDGDRIMIGAIGVYHGTSTGSAYVFQFSHGRWYQQARIDPLPNEVLSSFGHAVALSGDRAIISAFAIDHQEFTGSVFAYRLVDDQWVREARLMADQEPEAVLGWSLALDGQRVLVGAASSSTTPENGLAYLFERAPEGTWTQAARFVPVTKATNNVAFGQSVALQGPVAVVGAYGDHIVGHSDGAVYVFRQGPLNEWSLESKFGASDGASYDYFGYSVALQGDNLLVGAALRNQADVMDSGQAYLFRYQAGQWVEQNRMFDATLTDSAMLGYSVSLAGDMALVGAVGANAPAGASGTVCVFSASDADCNNNGVSDVCDISVGTSLDADFNSVPDECQTPDCPADCAPPSNGVVDIDDLVLVLTRWGDTGGWGSADIAPPGGNGTVNIDDLTAVVLAWGPCPQ